MALLGKRERRRGVRKAIYRLVIGKQAGQSCIILQICSAGVNVTPAARWLLGQG